MTTSSLLFRLPGSLGVLEITAEALAHFDANKQRRCTSREAGGQLFAVFDDKHFMRIMEATGPRRTDRRSLFGYEPDRVAEKAEIADYFARGLHFVGDWHTHRQAVPRPSATDERSMRDLVRNSYHDLPGFIMVIVGQKEFPEGIYVSFHSRAASSQLIMVDEVGGDAGGC